jgi:hypothetical protein
MNRRFVLSLAAIVVITLIRIAATHRVFSQTIDESAHLLAGYDILTNGIYNTDIHHPPLARVLFALPFVDAPEPQTEPRVDELLLRGGRYEHNLAAARMGNLLFVALAIIAVALWARHLFSDNVGLFAAIVLALLPPIIGHGGLATTDTALAATLPLALYALTLLLEQPTRQRTAFFAIALALGLLAKFSFLPFFAACAIVLFVVQRRFPWRQLLLATAFAFFAILAAYGFAFSSIADADLRGASMVPERLAHVRMPAPLYVLGLIDVRLQNADPPKAILFDHVRKGGWWYYFPVALFFKTPLAFLLLAIAGVRRRSLEIALLALAILAVAMTSHINIGVRHILPIYAPLAILAAVALTKRIAWVLVAWLVVSSAIAQANPIAWFNELAGKEPYHLLNDSNLDWGQDVLRLARLTRKEHLPAITTSLATNAPLDHLGFPPRTELQAMQPAVHGWLAVSEFNIALGRDYRPEVGAWLDALLKDRPYRRVGASIRLYHFD